MNNPKSPQTPKKKRDLINGWINLDKPAGMTSTDAVTQVRRILNAAKAGHGGTLDPLATGILPIALGEATKILPYVTDSLKAYNFTVMWGEQRDTDDLEGKVIATSDVRPTRDAILAALPRFVGKIQQIPPKYSALKVNGERAYDLARDGVDFTLPPREVFVESLTLTTLTPDTATLTCHCGKGTYIRSIARDLASMLGTKAYVANLRRLMVGSFHESCAISLDKLAESVANSAPHSVVLPLGAALDDIPALQLTPGEAVRLKQGQALELVTRADVERLTRIGLDPRITNDTLALATSNDTPLALLSATGPRLLPVRVFNL
jgi:tRNA pseudouridine55 synthase